MIGRDVRPSRRRVGAQPIGAERPHHRIQVVRGVRDRRPGQAPDAAGCRHQRGSGRQRLAVVHRHAVGGLRALRFEVLGVVGFVEDHAIPATLQQRQPECRVGDDRPSDNHDLPACCGGGRHDLYAATEVRPLVEGPPPDGPAGSRRHDKDVLVEAVIAGQDRGPGLSNAGRVRKQCVLAGGQKRRTAGLCRKGCQQVKVPSGKRKTGKTGKVGTCITSLPTSHTRRQPELSRR